MIKRTITAAFVAALLCPCLAWANFDNPSDITEPTIQRMVNDNASRFIAKIAQEGESMFAAQQENQFCGGSEAAYDAVYYSDGYGYQNGDGLTREGGINHFGGRLESWYSSNQLYHYRTGEWTVDNQGFYRTSDGYYVVAASDMPQGTVFQGSQGDCIVLDTGCAAGVTDYYVAW